MGNAARVREPAAVRCRCGAVRARAPLPAAELRPGSGAAGSSCATFPTHLSPFPQRPGASSRFLRDRSGPPRAEGKTMLHGARRITVACVVGLLASPATALAAPAPLTVACGDTIGPG